MIRLRGMIDGLSEAGGRPLNMRLSNDLDVGDAFVDNFCEGASRSEIGTAGLVKRAGNHDLPFLHVDDLRFVQTAVSIYHEYGHYLQNWGRDKDLNCMVSELSVINNPTYYRHNWNSLPHEIKAEAIGVSMAWDAMEEMFPGKADECMLAYVNHRAARTKYMLPAKPDGGYTSRDEVMAAFSSAMYRSLNAPRPLYGRVMSYDDESIHLVKQDFYDYHGSPNKFHASELIGHMSGAEKDRKFASLVLTLHPDLLDERPELKRLDLSVEATFGRPLVRTTLPGGAAPKKVDTGIRDVSDLTRALGGVGAGRSADCSREVEW